MSRVVVARRVERPVLGHGDVGRQRAAAEHAQVDVDDDVTGDAVARRDAAGGLDLVPVPLAVAERERVHGEALARREREAGRGIEAARQQDDGGRAVVWHPCKLAGPGAPLNAADGALNAHAVQRVATGAPRWLGFTRSHDRHPQRIHRVLDPPPRRDRRRRARPVRRPGPRRGLCRRAGARARHQGRAARACVRRRGVRDDRCCRSSTRRVPRPRRSRPRTS